MSAITTAQKENRAIIKHLVADARKPDGHWSLYMGWHKDLFPDGDMYKMDAMSANELVEIAKSANSKARITAKQLLLHVAQSGMALIALKEACQHGTFNCHLRDIGIEPRTAQNYMAIARKYETVSHLQGVKDALRFIREAQAKANQNDDDWTIQGEALPLDIGKPKASGVMIDAEIVDAPSPSPSIDDDVQPLVVDESKPAPAPSNGWDMARQFIETLKPLTAYHEVQALCDVIKACEMRLGELRKLKGKDKSQ